MPRCDQHREPAGLCSKGQRQTEQPDHQETASVPDLLTDADGLGSLKRRLKKLVGKLLELETLSCCSFILFRHANGESFAAPLLTCEYLDPEYLAS